MSTRLLNRKSAVVTLAVATVLVGGVAYGYPPNTELTVEATASPTSPPDPAGTKVLVTVSNANPACKVRVRVADGSEVVLPVSGTSATTSVIITPALPAGHRNDVRARTVDCTHGNRSEHAKNKFTVNDGKASGPGHATKGRYRVDVSGVAPGTPVSLVATAPDGTTSGPVSSDVGTVTDRRGTADLRVELDETGTWSIVVTAEPAGEPSASIGTVTTTVS